MSYRIVIPARFASQRLPGKPLRELAGKPMIQWVCERAARSAAAEVIVATDDERIASTCRGFGANVEMTRSDHRSGTDRVAEVAARRGWQPDEVVVNVQGDEPLLAPENIDQVAALAAQGGVDVATLAVPVTEPAEYRDPNAVKVVVDAAGHALYFSRAPIPWLRGYDLDAMSATEAREVLRSARKHLGIYAYTTAAVIGLSAAPAAPSERCERLEQLRALHLGLTIAVGDAAVTPGPGVDTEADLARAAGILQAHGRR